MTARWVVEGQKENAPFNTERVTVDVTVSTTPAGSYKAVADTLGHGFGPTEVAAIRDLLRLNGYGLRVADKRSSQL